MVAADGQADLAVGLEAAGGGDEAEGRGFERVLGREDDAAVVDAAGVDGARGAAEGEVPFEEVGFEGGRGVVGGGGGEEFLGFADYGGGRGG